MHFIFSCFIFQTANKYRTITSQWKDHLEVQIFSPSSTILSDKLQQVEA